MERSGKKLVNGSWWRVFGILLLIGILVSIFASIISYPLLFLSLWLFGHVAGQIVSGILNFCIYALITPVSLIAYTLLYYDLRIRKENLDLETMVDDLAESGGQPTGVQA
jgi:hypothetical protein